MRLVDTDAIKLPKGFFESVDNVPKFYEWLNTLPTIEPVQHGKWILVDGKYYCSEHPEQQWIPCSERLPEANTRCLCTYENKEGTCVDFGLYMKHGWFVSGVTAWMPLPESYKEEADDPER